MIFLVTHECVLSPGGLKKPGDLHEGPCRQKASPWLIPIRWRLPTGWQKALDIANNLVLRNRALVTEGDYVSLWKAKFIYFTVTWIRGEKEATTRTLDKIEDVWRRGFSQELLQVYRVIPNKLRPLWGCETPQQERQRIAITCEYQHRVREANRPYDPLSW